MKRVLFICTGNTCRSPLAEGIYRLEARKRGLDVEARSAGTNAIQGLPVSGHSADILRDKGASLASEGSSELSAALVEWSDLILTMTMGHKRHLVSQYPAAIDKTYTLKEYADVSDSAYQQTLAQERQFASDLQIKQALGEQITAAERIRLDELTKRASNYDISDPFGGPAHVYRQSAEEIEAAILRMLDNLTKE